MVAFQDNIWHVMLTTASPYTLTSITRCQGKAGLVSKQVDEVVSCSGYGLTEGKLRDVAALNGALKQDVWVVRTLLLTCSLLSG
jgi:hypothetical protein